MIRDKPVPVMVFAWLIGVAWGLKVQMNFFYIFLTTAFLLIGQLMFHYVSHSTANWRRPISSTSLPSQTLLLLTILMAGLCWSTGFKLWDQPQLPKISGGQSVTVVGKVVSPVKTRTNSESFVLRAEQIKVDQAWISINELTEVISYNQELSFEQGDTIAVEGGVRTPGSPTNPNAFNYSQYLMYQRIYSQLIIKSTPEIISKEPFWQPLKLAQSYKKASIETIIKLLPGSEGSTLAAMTFGWRQGLTPQQQEIYAKAGLLHIFAVSGLHMGFVILGGIGLLKILKANKFLSFVIMVILITAYAAMADFSVSATRAGLMGIIGFSIHLLQREKNFYTSLSLAALVLTLINPYYLYQVGFQLSFLATWGIVFLYHPLTKLFNKSQTEVSWWKKGIIVSAAAQIAIAPLLAYHFNMVSALGLLSNIVANWLVAVCVLVGLIVYPVSLLWDGLAELLLVVCGGGIYYLTIFNQEMIKLPGYTYIQAPSWAALFFYYLSIIYFVTWRSGQLELLGRKLFNWHFPLVSRGIAVGLISFLFISWFPIAQDKLEITVLDVGQGDAIVIILPNGKNILIDGGGLPGPPDRTFDVGEKIVVPFLRSKGINTIDLLINTHGHYDHVAGLLAVIRNFPVRQALISPVPANTKTYEEFLDLLLSNNIPTLEGRWGQSIELDPRVNIQVIHPHNPILGTSSDLNENSIVLHLVYGDFSMLFSGDIEQQAMSQLVEQNIEIASTVYKVAHHGSKTGHHEQFLRKVDPLIAVIPVGRNNFGHPDKKLLELIEQLGAVIYRTDINGGIRIITDGKEMSIETSLPKL